jgi:hypothetical protein
MEALGATTTHSLHIPSLGYTIQYGKRLALLAKVGGVSSKSVITVSIASRISYVAKSLNDDCMVPTAPLQVGVNTLTFLSVSERCGVNAADRSSILVTGHWGKPVTIPFSQGASQS